MLSHLIIGKEFLTFGDIEIEKNKFYHHKSPILLKDIDTEKVLVSNYSSGEKNYTYFIDTCITIILYNDYKVKPLHIMPPKTHM